MKKQVVMNGKDHIIIKFDQFFQIGRNMIQLLGFIVRVPYGLVLLIKKYIQATTKKPRKKKNMECWIGSRLVIETRAKDNSCTGVGAPTQ